jgi:hypothetical protein
VSVVEVSDSAVENSRVLRLPFCPDFVTSCRCRLLTVEGSDSGSVVSHAGFGSVGFPNNHEVFWNIRVQSGKVVKVKFSKLSLQFCCDSVQVFAANDTCNSDDAAAGTSFVSESNSLVVRFSSDATTESDGFLLTFETVDPEEGESEVEGDGWHR